jgi:hypothetical protein
MQRLSGNVHRPVRRDDVDVIGLRLHAIGDLFRGHRRLPGEHFRQHAVMFRVEMLNQYKCDPRVNREATHQITEGFEPPAELQWRQS